MSTTASCYMSDDKRKLNGIMTNNSIDDCITWTDSFDCQARPNATIHRVKPSAKRKVIARKMLVTSGTSLRLLPPQVLAQCSECFKLEQRCMILRLICKAWDSA